MDNFLTALYFERFQIIERERKLMNNTTWADTENGRIDNVRNDQSIGEVRCQLKMVDKLIDAYIQKIKNE